MKRPGDRPPIAVTPTIVPGLEATEAGHRVVERAIPGWEANQRKYKDDPENYDLGWEFVCSCGWFVHGSLNKAGSVGRRIRVAWEGHLDAARNEALIITMGKVHRKRSIQTVQVMPSTLALTLGFDAASRWREYTMRNPWLCVATTDTKNTSKQKILFGYFEREACVVGAREYLRREEETYQVEHLEEGAPQVTMVEETSRLLAAADRAIETKNLRDIAEAWSQFEAFDSLRPLIAQKRDEIEYLRTTLLLKSAK